jgi:hypothetical protein
MSSYDRALLAYDYTVEELKKPRDEYAGKQAIKWAKTLHGHADHVLEDVHKYPVTQSRRLRFAIKMFFVKALWYFVFLSLLTAGTFLSTSNNDVNTFYFVQTMRESILEGGQTAFDDIKSANAVYLVRIAFINKLTFKVA